MTRQSVIESVIINNETIDIVKSKHFHEQYYTRATNKPTIISEWKNKGIINIYKYS